MLNDFTGHDTTVLTQAELYISKNEFDRPTLVVSKEDVVGRYKDIKEGLGDCVRIHYALKANPHPDLLSALVEAGSGFDAASRGEIEACLAAGASPMKISYGNTIKKVSDIIWAHKAGITLFAADSEEELQKISKNAPGSRVYIRLIVENSAADWPLTRKFGCDASEVSVLFDMAVLLGLHPIGMSFHVGSQTREPEMWDPVLKEASKVWSELKKAGHSPTLLNIGGGFPASYTSDSMDMMSYTRSVRARIDAAFGVIPDIMAEPGRGLVGESGAIAAEVVLVSRKSSVEAHRWVYLDIGRFSGLAETEGEAIRYQILTTRDGDAVGPCIVAGNSCDSADVLYEKGKMMLPFTLECGDKVILRATGAYTSTYSSVGFNGFPPLDVVVV